MNVSQSGHARKPAALSLLASERPRNVGWKQAAGLLFGDWGTSRLYVLGIGLFFAGRTSFWLILMMSLLIAGVGWGYSQICRIYPDGGGVYTAAKHRSRTLAVIGALLLFADYTVTASISALDAFEYFGLPVSAHVQTQAKHDEGPDAGDQLDVKRETPPDQAEKLFQFDSPALWAILAIAVIGAFNFMGPKHTGSFAIFAAVGMVLITLLISAFAIPKVQWGQLPQHIGHVHHNPGQLWIGFVSIVLALSGVEAIANLTGVMVKPVQRTARKAIWVVTLEVGIFNVLLAVCMLNLFPLNRDAHQGDMLAYLANVYVGGWGEWGVRILGGLLLLSATNTAITDMISIQYLMARDNELPQSLVGLNRFGVPWMPAIIAASIPILVLLVVHDLDALAALYAIGVIGAIAINISLCSIHPRLRGMRRKIPMMLLGAILVIIWVTLAFTKLHALVFVTVVMIVGLTARQITRWYTGRRERPSLLRQAIMEQLTPEVLARPKVLLGTYGSDALAKSAVAEAQRTGHSIAVCFIREVNLSYKFDSQRQTIDTDPAAIRTFSRFLELGHEMGVGIIPIYDSGPNAAELMAENAAVYGCDKVLIGTSRQGALYHLLRGHFQQRLEAILPPEIPVQVIAPSIEEEPKSSAEHGTH
ncbi:MAG TPA: universal stress protein [Tepidisphaeraceae bacterium]|jgi:amino acid transporter